MQTFIGICPTCGNIRKLIMEDVPNTAVVYLNSTGNCCDIPDYWGVED